MTPDEKAKNDARKRGGTGVPNPKGNVAARRKAKRADLQRTVRLPGGRIRRAKRLATNFVFGTKKLRKLAMRISRNEMRQAIETLAKVPTKSDNIRSEETRPVKIDEKGWRDYRTGSQDS